MDRHPTEDDLYKVPQSVARNMDWAITDTLLVTMRDGTLGIVEDGAIGIDNGEIAYVGPSEEIEPGDAEVIDGSGRATIPGLVDVHAHTGLTLLRGGAQDVPEIEWMNDALGPIANHSRSEDLVAGARLGVLEAVRSGATTVVEYAGEVGRLVEAVYRPTGVRVVAVETINEVPEDRAGLGPCELYPFDREKGDAALERADELFEQFGDDPLVVPAYGPQALDMVSPELLSRVHERAHERSAKLHVHVAQGERERLQVQERYGAGETTVSVLDDLDVIDDRLVAAHCHGTTAEERRLLVDRDVALAACPSSIGMIDGICPPIADYLDAGGIVGLGTDQAPGGGHHSMLREARVGALLSKVDATDPTAVPAWQALRAATVGGARALGLDDRIGTLAVGKRADVVTVDLERLGIAPSVDEPFHTAIPNLVYSSTGREVRDVFVDGEPLLREGSFVGIDARDAIADARERAQRVFADAAGDWREAGSELVDRVDEGWL